MRSMAAGPHGEFFMENTIKTLLIDLGISDEKSIVPFFPRVRDRNDISVMRCNKSGVIFLSRTDHMNISHYKELERFQYWGAEDQKTALRMGREDAERRLEQFRNTILNKKWLDVGTGAGGTLNSFSPIA